MAKYQAYAEYKDSGVEWLGVVPSHWIITTLKRYCYVKGGFAFSSDAFIDTGYPVIRIGDIKTDGSINLENCKYIPESLAVNSRDYLVEKNQLLMAMTGATIGKAGLYTSNQPAFLNQRVGKFELLAQNMNYRYLWYILKTDGYQEYIKLTAFGGAQPNISDTAMVDYPATIPSFDEQTQIANFLDHETSKIDHLIEKQQRLIELLKEKRQAVISHAVTKGLNPNVPMKDSGVEWLGEVPEHWNMAPVRRYLVEHRQGYYTTESYVDEGLKLLRITDLRDLGEINISNCPMVNESDTTHLFKLQKGDVVFARTGGAGSFGVITEDYENLIYASYLIRFRFMNKIFEPDYLRFLFQSDSFQLSVKQNIHGGVNQNIHAEDIKNTVICAPSLSEQKEIIEYLENQCLLFENLIYKASYSVKLMQERRTALISAAVTGKIDVRNWQAPTLAEADTELSA